MTLITVALLLITAFVGLLAQDHQGSSAINSGENQARRVLMASDVSMNGDSKKQQAASEARQSVSPHMSKKDEDSSSTLISEDDFAPTDKIQSFADLPELNKVTLSANGIKEPAARLSATSGELASVSTANPTGVELPSLRQTRATTTTTKKHSGDINPGTTQATLSSSSGSIPVSTPIVTPAAGGGVTEEEEEEEADEVSKAPPPAKSKRRRRRKKKLTTTSTESEKAVPDEDKEQEQVETEAVEERPKDRSKKGKHQNKGGPTAASTVSPASVAAAPHDTTTDRAIKQTGVGLASQPTTSKLSASVANKKSNDPGKTRLSGASSAAENLQKNQQVKSKPVADSSLDHEYYDDDESTSTQTAETANKAPNESKPVDFSKVKLIGLNKYNESVANNQTNGQLSTVKPIVSLGQPSSPSAPTITSSNPSESTASSVVGHQVDLDSRSPSAQPGFAKRLTNKWNRPTTPMPPTSPSSADTRFAYSKPYSSINTTQPTPNAPSSNNLTAGGMFVQILNPPADPKNRSSLASNSSEDSNLDWSKLVKVVFKSARDNHTVYTVVMNSSELSNHPINDWSNELPRLLRGDFEKLIQKWSNVFPFDHLMIDLGKIIINKVSSSPSTNNSLAKNAVLAKLNDTLPFNATAGTRLPVGIDSISQAVLSKPTETMSTFSNSTNLVNAADQTLKTPTSSLLKPVSLNTTVWPLNIQNHNYTQPLNTTHAKNDTAPRINGSMPIIHFDTNSSMTSSSPRGLNISMDHIKSTIPWSSSHDLSSLPEAATRGAVSNNSKSISSPIAEHGKTNGPYVTVASTTPNTTGKLANVTSQPSRGEPKILHEDNAHGNHHLAEIMKDMNEEHIKLGNDVKEEAGSLRHFIIVCSISVVIATSLIMILIVKLFK